MKFAVDFHIHSCLSPCGDNDMTPNNIVNMALLKGLDVISVTDHNTALNLPAVQEAAVKNGIAFLPGIEVQTKEEVHMLCYFKSVENAVEFGNSIYGLLPDIENNPRLFGDQIIMDSCDNVTGYLNKLLLSSADITIDALLKKTQIMEGVCIPAHIDRPSFSIITNLGFIPDDLHIRTVEMSSAVSDEETLYNTPYIKSMRILHSSDAHYLWDISERIHIIDLQYLTMTSILNYIKGQ